MPEVKRSPATPDRSPSRSRCSLAIEFLKFPRPAEKSATVVSRGAIRVVSRQEEI